jgi:excinuclease ABC subunit C
MTYQIGRCTAPCVDYVSREDYARDIEAALGLLRGEDKKVRSDLERKMKAASQQERYEAAAKYRDALKAVEQIWARQVVVSGDEKGDQDVFVFKGDGRGTLVESLHVRHGRLMGSRPHFLPRFDCNAEGEDPREWLVSFLNQYYSDNMVPDQILLGVDIGGDMKKLLGDVMLSRHGKRAQIVELMSGGDADLYEKALAMAEEHWKAQMSAEQKKLSGLEEIQRRFVLPELPRRIECFDISNFQGREAVASQVVFEDGRPRKEDYRRYKIRTAEGTPNDFMAMKEALSRRLRHTEYEDPQLIVVDGGKGQLNVAIQVLQELGRPDIPVVGLAKARTQGAFTQATVDASEERFFLPGRQNPLLFKPGSEAFQILVGVRDEAHRFALSYHRKLREAVSIASQLDEIPGLGEKRKSALLKKFSGPEAILSANIDEIASLRGFNRVLAERIKLHLEGAAGGASEQTSVGVDTVGTDNKS